MRGGEAPSREVGRLLQGCANQGFTRERAECGETAEAYSDYLRIFMKMGCLCISTWDPVDSPKQKSPLPGLNGK